jgi:hypothetical protein
MGIVDFHTHAFPDSLASRAVAAIVQRSGMGAESDGTVGGLLGVMDRAGVERAVVHSIATKPEHFESILSWSVAVASGGTVPDASPQPASSRIDAEDSARPDPGAVAPKNASTRPGSGAGSGAGLGLGRIVPFASVHPDSPGAAEAVGRIARAGIRGIKLHPLYQSFAVDDPRVFPLYEAIAAERLILMMHAGYDIAFGKEDLASPARFVRVVERFPGLRLVLAHLGGWNWIDLFIERLAGKDLYIDTAFCSGYCSDAQRDRLLSRHSTDRILFGSDSPWARMDEHVRFVRALPVSDAVKEKILGRNAERFLADR